MRTLLVWLAVVTFVLLLAGLWLAGVAVAR